MFSASVAYICCDEEVVTLIQYLVPPSSPPKTKRFVGSAFNARFIPSALDDKESDAVVYAGRLGKLLWNEEPSGPAQEEASDGFVHVPRPLYPRGLPWTLPSQPSTFDHLGLLGDWNQRRKKFHQDLSADATPTGFLRPIASPRDHFRMKRSDDGIPEPAREKRHLAAMARMGMLPSAHIRFYRPNYFSEPFSLAGDTGYNPSELIPPRTSPLLSHDMEADEPTQGKANEETPKASLKSAAILKNWINGLDSWFQNVKDTDSIPMTKRRRSFRPPKRYYILPAHAALGNSLRRY
ncbi:unnamed protein product [Cyprideis torosa]|uniref:Uncharacterized protein n=1 Tax=Cyprideis torosa TaxID=163714 RepID=A0A7R8WG03_9CRUS|nr:unnamed protein product [Cyprideis torosa]CAG0897626.1 unnamed protein product [Cyprideis torosa]